MDRLHDMRIHSGTDYLTVYKNMRNQQGCILKAREIVIEIIIKNEGLTPFGARQVLYKLISNDASTKGESHEQQERISALR